MTGDRSGDTSGDISGDMSGDGRWMTYDELAKLRGIARASAERLVLRNRWRRQRGNDRTVRILVPTNGLSGDMSDDVSGDVSADTGLLLSGALSALEDAVSALREQLDASNARAERAEADRADERMRADRLSAQVEALSIEVMRGDAAGRDKERAEAEGTPYGTGSRRCRSSWPPVRRGWTPPRRSARPRPWSTASARPMPARSVLSRQSATDWRRRSTGSRHAPIRPRLAPIACALGSMSCSVTGTPHALRPRRPPWNSGRQRPSSGRGGWWRGSGRRGGGSDLGPRGSRRSAARANSIGPMPAIS